MNKVLLLLLVLVACFFIACEETEEGVDNNNDIIIRNVSEYDRLWIRIDGSNRGSIEDNGIARTMWDGIPDGIHVLQAFRDDAYSVLHCQVTTDYLDDGEDFHWYLLEDHEYGGTHDGDC